MKNVLAAIGITLGLCSTVYANQPEIEFAGVTYKLASAQVAMDGSVTDEYVPLNETIASWTTLLAVRQWPKEGSLRLVVGAWLRMVQPLLARDVQSFEANGSTNRNDRIVEAWISAPDKSYIEIDLYRFLREKGTAGIKAYQFAQKIKMVAGKGDPTPFMKNRSALFAALEKLAISTHKTPEALRAELAIVEQEVAELRTCYKDSYPSIKMKLRTIAELKKQLDSEEPNQP